MARDSEDYGPSDDAGHGITVDKYFKYARSLGLADGVINSSNVWKFLDLQVTGTGTTNVTVRAGGGNAMGEWYQESSGFTIPVPANTGSTARTDLVVVRVVQVSGKFQATVMYLPNTPNPTRNFGVLWDLPLALITMPANSATVPASAVRDIRRGLGRGITTTYKGQDDPRAFLGQILLSEPNIVKIAQDDGNWEQIWPIPNPDWRSMVPILTSEFADAVGGGYYNAAYCKDAMGWVHLRGRVKSKSGTAPANSVIARLPTEYRAGASSAFSVKGSTSKPEIIVNGDDDASDSGKIRIVQSMPSDGTIHLDGISYWSGH